MRGVERGLRWPKAVVSLRENRGPALFSYFFLFHSVFRERTASRKLWASAAAGAGTRWRGTRSRRRNINFSRHIDGKQANISFSKPPLPLHSGWKPRREGESEKWPPASTGSRSAQGYRSRLAARRLHGRGARRGPPSHRLTPLPFDLRP